MHRLFLTVPQNLLAVQREKLSMTEKKLRITENLYILGRHILDIYGLVFLRRRLTLAVSCAVGDKTDGNGIVRALELDI